MSLKASRRLNKGSRRTVEEKQAPVISAWNQHVLPETMRAGNDVSRFNIRFENWKHVHEAYEFY
jgi:hypothetical protein